MSLSLACFWQPWGALSLLESTQLLCAFGCPHSLVNPILTFPLFYFSNEFSRMVAGEYLKFFVFTGMSLDQALRSELTVCTCVCVWWPPEWGPNRLCPLQPHRDLQEQADPMTAIWRSSYLLNRGG